MTERNNEFCINHQNHFNSTSLIADPGKVKVYIGRTWIKWGFYAIHTFILMQPALGAPFIYEAGPKYMIGGPLEKKYRKNATKILKQHLSDPSQYDLQIVEKPDLVSQAEFVREIRHYWERYNQIVHPRYEAIPTRSSAYGYWNTIFGIPASFVTVTYVPMVNSNSFVGSILRKCGKTNWAPDFQGWEKIPGWILEKKDTETQYLKPVFVAGISAEYWLGGVVFW